MRRFGWLLQNGSGTFCPTGKASRQQPGFEVNPTLNRAILLEPTALAEYHK